MNYKQSSLRIYNKLGNTDTVRQIITWSDQFSANFLKLDLYSLLYGGKVDRDIRYKFFCLLFFSCFSQFFHPRKQQTLIMLPGNKLEGDWGEIVALGAEISPSKDPREKWSLPEKKKKKKKNFFFFF